MKDFISDAEMGGLEKAGKAKMPDQPKSADFLTDDQMAAFEKSGKAKAPEKEGAGQAALESFGNAATLGYLPHLQALAGKLVPDPNSGLDAELAAKGFKVKNAPEKGYIAERDDNIKRQAQQKKDFPMATTAGTVGGIVGGGLMIPGAALAKGASLGVRALQGAKAGAVMGGLMNPGDTAGDVSLMPIERLENAAAGMGLGAVLPAGMSLLGKGAKAASGALADTAAWKAFRALGRGTPTATQKMVDSGQGAVIGRELLDEGAIPVLGTPNRIAGRVDSLKEKAGEQVGNLVKGAGNAKLVDAEKLGLEILDSPELALMRKTPGMEGTVSKIEQQVETLAKNGQMSLEQAQALRQSIDKSINFNKGAGDLRGAQEGLFMQRTKVRDAMNEGINTLNPGAPKNQLLTANRKYGNLATAEGILEKEMARNQSNRAISLTDTIAAGAGASTGNPAAALILGAINKAGRTFGNSVQARGYDAMAKSLAKIPAVVEMAQSNPGVVSRLATSLGQDVAGGVKSYAVDKDDILNDPEILMLFKKDENLLQRVEDPKRRALIKEALKRLPASR